MGIWADHFHPNKLLEWVVLGWIIPGLIAVGGIMLTVDQFIWANACFVLVAFFAIAKIAAVAIAYRGSALNAVVFSFLLCGLVGAGIVAAVRGVNLYGDRRAAQTGGSRSEPGQDEVSSPHPSLEEVQSNPVTKSEPRRTKSDFEHPQIPATYPRTHPDISATFFQGASPGLLIVNRSNALIKSPVAHFAMWNLSRVPALMIPAWDVQQSETFIKPSSGLIWATADTPHAKPFFGSGDKLFALVVVDCPDCKTARSYYLYFVYGQAESSWFSEVPEGKQANMILVNDKMQESAWNVETYMQKVDHGPVLPVEPANRLIGPAQRR